MRHFKKTLFRNILFIPSCQCPRDTRMVQSSETPLPCSKDSRSPVKGIAATQSVVMLWSWVRLTAEKLSPPHTCVMQGGCACKYVRDLMRSRHTWCACSKAITSQSCQHVEKRSQDKVLYVLNDDHIRHSHAHV